MEKPYSGRATIIDSISGIEITIPAKRNWFILVFLGGWLGGWFCAEVFVIGMVTGFLTDNPAGLFVLFWLIGWTAGGVYTIRTFLWMIAGKESILIERGQLTIDKKGALFVKAKTYDLNEVKNIRVAGNDNKGAWGYQQNNWMSLGTNGTIKFDYGLKTIRMADGIDEAEASYLIARLREKGIVKV
jgi:hypothetical protein